MKTEEEQQVTLLALLLKLKGTISHYAAVFSLSPSAYSGKTSAFGASQDPSRPFSVHAGRP
jgi:hypothetical protein